LNFQAWIHHYMLLWFSSKFILALSTPKLIFLGHNRFEYLRSNVALRVLLIFGLWLLTGLFFYTQTQGWTFYNAYFYCISVGFNIGFANLVEIDYDPYHAFTIAFVLLGSSIVSGAIGYLMSFLISNSNMNAPTAYTFDTVTFGLSKETLLLLLLLLSFLFPLLYIIRLWSLYYWTVYANLFV